MGIFGKKVQKPQIEVELTEEDKDIPLEGEVYFMWGPEDRRRANQSELEQLQVRLAINANDRLSKYTHVLQARDVGYKMKVVNMPIAEFSLLGLIKLDRIGKDVTLHDVDKYLGVERGYSSERLDWLVSNGFATNNSASSSLSYELTEKGIETLKDAPYLLEVLAEKEYYGLDVYEAYALMKKKRDADLFEECREMYRELMTYSWALGKYRDEYTYAGKLAYLMARRNPEESCYALAHLINANNVFDYKHNLWERPLKKVYKFSDLTIEDTVRYVKKEFKMGIYPKNTNTLGIEKVFNKSLKKIKKAEANSKADSSEEE